MIDLPPLKLKRTPRLGTQVVTINAGLLHFHSTSPESEGSMGDIVLIGVAPFGTPRLINDKDCYQALVSAGAMGAETRAAMTRAASKTKKSAVAKGNHRTRRGRTSHYSG
jgi:hypothetical protein